MNNPTINGVSRELIAEAALTLRLAGGNDGLSEDLRALLDSPAVERQEPVTMKRQYISVPGLWIECAADDLQAMTFYKQTPEVAALQSTIAQLQARIAELESGRGEPVYQVSDGVNGWRDVDRLKLTACQLDPEEYECRVLFTAPPVPVAVVLPERRTPEHYHARIGKCGAADMLAEEWNACLDATAALNGERK